MFSHRSNLDRTPHRLARAQAKARASGRPLVDLTESNPTRVNLPYDHAAILKALQQPETSRYEPHPFGVPAARRAVADHVGAAADRVMLTASTSEAYAHLFTLLCDPGDEVLVPHPSYPLLDMLARIQSVRLVPYHLAYDGEWHVDRASLRRAFGTRARAVLAVSPNNPTGHLLTAEDLEALTSLGLPVVCDEVFAAYVLDPPGPRVATARQARDALVLTLGGLSKECALPQMKLAWTVVDGPEPLVREALGRLEWIADTFLSPSIPVQLAAGELLRSGLPVRQALRARLRRNLATLARVMAPPSPATPLRTEGGWYAVVRVPRSLDEDDWALAALEAGVIVQPGWLYDFPEPGYLVLSLLPEEETFSRGSALLARTVAERA